MCYKYYIIIHPCYIEESTENKICSFEQKFIFHLLKSFYFFYYSFFFPEIVFFDIYVNLPVLSVKNAFFGVIPFSKVNSIF